MTWLPLLLALQSVFVPLTRLEPPADPSLPHSLVVATTVKQTDPRPIDCGRSACTSWFKSTYTKATTIAGAPLPADFVADLEMGSPFESSYELVMVVEHRPDGTLRVNEQLGFGDRTHEACFGPQVAALFPGFEMADRLVRRHKAMCVKER